MIEVSVLLLVNGALIGARLYDRHRARWAWLLRLKPVGGEQ